MDKRVLLSVLGLVIFVTIAYVGVRFFIVSSTFKNSVVEPVALPQESGDLEVVVASLGATDDFVTDVSSPTIDDIQSVEPTIQVAQAPAPIETPAPEEIANASIGFGGLISAQEFNAKINSDEYVVLDMRTPTEYNEQRTAEDALSISFFDQNFQQQLVVLDKTKKYLIYCADGECSAQVPPMMKELGFQEFYGLQGGIDSWVSSGLPTVSGNNE